MKIAVGDDDASVTGHLFVMPHETAKTGVLPHRKTLTRDPHCRGEARTYLPSISLSCGNNYGTPSAYSAWGSFFVAVLFAAALISGPANPSPDRPASLRQ